MNPFYISSIILSLTSFILGLTVYLKDRNNNLSKQWFVFSTFLAGWAMALFLVVSSGTATIAFRWQYLLDIFALWIPVGYFSFTTTLLSLKKTKLFYIISSIAMLLSIFSFTSLFKVGMVQKFGFFWIDPGSFYFLFPLFFIIVVIYSIFLLIHTYFKQTKDSVLRSQIRYQIIAGAIGFSGGVTNFLPQLFNVFPFGNYFVIIYVFFISYSILKYKLFNIKIVLVELAILLLNMFLLFNVFTSHATVDFVINISIFIGILIFSIFLMRGIYKDIRDRERIAVLAQEMEVANDRLRMMEGQKTEFVSIASHQLRTPLTVIKGYASMILEGTFGDISAEVRDAVDKLYKSSERIVALVEDLLTVSRIEQGRMTLNFSVIDFKEFVEQTIEDTQPEIEESKLEFSFTAKESGDFRVSIDEKKFKQVVRHVLDNAIKYTRAPGKVHLVLAEDPVTKKVRLSISDTGAGMSAEQIHSVFERFNLKSDILETTAETETMLPPEEKNEAEKAEDAKVQKELAEEKAMMEKRTPGIGLYIAQEIIEAHNGTLRLESSGVGRGTTVFIELPKVE